MAAHQPRCTRFIYLRHLLLLLSHWARVDPDLAGAATALVTGADIERSLGVFSSVLVIVAYFWNVIATVLSTHRKDSTDCGLETNPKLSNDARKPTPDAISCLQRLSSYPCHFLVGVYVLCRSPSATHPPCQMRTEPGHWTTALPPRTSHETRHSIDHLRVFQIGPSI